MSKQKPILEWLEMLPDGYREICKAEYNPEFVSSNTYNYLSESINFLCNWSSSKIGYAFLQELYTAINADNIINHSLLPTLPENWKSIYKDNIPEETLGIKKPKTHNKKRDKLAIKIYLAWQCDSKTCLIHPAVADTPFYTFEEAMNQADEIIKKINQ